MAKLHFETLQVHAGQENPDSATGARAVPIYQTSSYVFKDSEQAAARFGLTDAGQIYSRLGNPTNDVFEARVNALEGGVGALAVASGSSAIYYAVRNVVTAGDHIVSASTLYGGTLELFSNTLKEEGVETTYVKSRNPEDFEKAFKPNTKVLYFETLGNPDSSILDVDALVAVAHKHGIVVIVDNTFATPYVFRPIEHGVDVVVHSATKFIGGHGTSIGGIIVDAGLFDWDKYADKYPGLAKPNPAYHGLVFTQAAGKAAYITKIRTTLLRDTGAILAPLNSFLFLQGLETLSLRVERHISNALKVVEYLSKNPKIEHVDHPSLPDSPSHELYKKYFPNGAGSIFTIEVKGGAKEARAFIDKLKLFSQLANVADAKSLAIHPATTTHSQLTEQELLDAGIKPNTVRLSIGIEHIDDIIADLEQALA
ncbi:MAG: O-acetylhomoserine aminocarboxypropyltransferase/cysteine synthase [Treponema sp.]|nr:O-acetylhomoserine aminocarboxypropyltransferase/cysteine synthase [Treponema sp.]